MRARPFRGWSDPDLRRELRSAALLALGGLVAIACGVAFVLLADEVWEGDLDRFDQRVLGWIAARRTPWLTSFFADATSLGSRLVLIVLALGVVAGLWAARRRGMAIALAVSMAGAVAISQTIKAVVGRARPDVAFRLQETSGYAFPSGHAINAIVFFLTVALLVATHVRGRALRGVLFGYALALGALVSLSRVYLGLHYPTDVIGSLLVGTAWSVAVVVAERLWRHRGGGSPLATPRR